MSSIYDIPYKDIEEFLLVNNINFESKSDAYDKASILLKDKKTVGHTISIIEWIMARNLFVNKIDIPNYTIYEIDNMSQDEINELAKLLTMKGRNRENIKNIFRYLHKLDGVKIGNIGSGVTEKKDIVISNKDVLDDVKVLPPSNTPYVYRFNLPQSFEYKKILIKDLIKIMKFLNLQDSDFTGSGKDGNLLRQDRIDIINNFQRNYGGNVIHINNPIINNGNYGFDYNDL